MFRRYKRRHTNILFVIFRLFLSMIIFAALLGGIFSAYKHFSGVNPLSLSPKAMTDVLSGLLSQSGLAQDLKNQISQKEQISTPAFVFRFMLLADSHSDINFLKKSLDQVKKDYPDIRFIIGLGDYTDVGSIDELKRTKEELDSSGFRYFVIPGDHDLWDSRNKSLTSTTNFSQIFGPPYQSFIHENFKFIMLNNSDNYIGLGDDQKKWMSDQLSSNKDVLGTFVFLHEPLFHPSSDHFMGRVQQSLKIEAGDLTKQLAQSGVKKVFAGDTHFFSEYLEPSTNLSLVTVGAITSVRNLQLPRFAIVSVFEDGLTRIEDVEVR